MDVTVIIVNYNTAELIKICIDSVLRQIGVQFEIIVVDNLSKDNSLDVLSKYGSKIRVFANSENVGFGKANNQAAQQSQGRYLFFLNPDANLESSNDLKQLVTFMDTNLSCGLAGPRIMKDQNESTPCHNYPGQKYLKFDFSHLPGNIAWVLGAAMITHHDLFKKIGGFDERFFLYGEEVDLCLRVRQQGYTIGHVPDVMIKHIGGASERTSAIEQTWRRKQNGFYNFITKNYPLPLAIRLIKRNRRLAKIRFFLLAIKKQFSSLPLEKMAKYERYKVIIKTSDEFLLKYG